MIGLILASTPAARRLRQLTHPLRDGFGAIFFFHFGLTIDIGDVLAVLPQVLVAAAATVVLAVVAGIVAARLHGLGRLGAANIGLTVLTRGEFSLVLASLAPFTLLWYASSTDHQQAVLFNAAMFGSASLAGQGLLRRHCAPFSARSRSTPPRAWPGGSRAASSPGTGSRSGGPTACRWTWTSGPRPCTNWAPTSCRSGSCPGPACTAST